MVSIEGNRRAPPSALGLKTQSNVSGYFLSFVHAQVLGSVGESYCLMWYGRSSQKAQDPEKCIVARSRG